MNRLPKGNCPFCDAESGEPSIWGMSPVGWAEMRKKHESGHQSTIPFPISYEEIHARRIYCRDETML